MKTLNLNLTKDIFEAFALTIEEMIHVRGGGELEPTARPSEPPVKI